MRNNQKDIFSNILASKMIILMIIIFFLVIYAVISIIILFSSDDGILSLITKIAAPLGMIGIASVLSVDCFYKMSSNKNIVKVFGLITFILSIIDVILLTLMIWEIIPVFEKNTASLGYFYSYSITPSIAYKLTMSLLSVTGFTFLGSIVLNVKEDHHLIRISKYISVCFLAIASTVSIVSNFISFKTDPYGGTRMGILQAISWITAISLGATVFYLSKTIDWEKRKSKTLTAGSDEKTGTTVSATSDSANNTQGENFDAI